jgi:hypothetical protein
MEILMCLVLSFVLKYAQTKTGHIGRKIQGILVYAHKHEKYPKGYYHKILKKLKYQKYFTKWKTTFIFVDLHFPERLWCL